MSSANMYAIQRDDHSAPWFDAASEGRLLIRECSGGHTLVPQAITCPHCGSIDLSWVEASREATLASYAVINRRDADPLPVAIVELAEGPWLRMQIQGVAEADLQVGLPVEVRFATPDDGEPIPYATTK